MSSQTLPVTAWATIRKGRLAWTLSFLYVLGILITSILSNYFRAHPVNLVIELPVLLLSEAVAWVGQLGVIVCLYRAAQGRESSFADLNAGVQPFLPRWVFVQLSFEVIAVVSRGWLLKFDVFSTSLASLGGILTVLAFDTGDYLLTILALYMIVSAIDGDQYLIPTALLQGAWGWLKHFGTTVGLALFLASIQVLLGVLAQGDLLGLLGRRASVLLYYGWLFLSLPFVAAFILAVYFQGREEKAPAGDTVHSGKP